MRKEKFKIHREKEKFKILIYYGPPGTGKTTKLINYASNNKVPKKKRKSKKGVAFFTFSKAAEKEIKERTGGAFHVKTLHAQAYLMACAGGRMITHDDLIEFGKKYGYTFTEYDEEGQAKTVGDEYLNAYNYMRSQRGDDSDYLLAVHLLVTGNTKGFYDFIHDYTNWKESNYRLDFNDILKEAVFSKKELPFKHIIIDEAQDLSPLMWDFVHMLVEMSKDLQSLLIGGDDDQSIYTWAGANPHGIEEEMGMYKNVERYVLPRTYRLSSAVYDFSKALISKVEHRVDKIFFPTYKIKGEIIRLVSHWDIPAPRDCMYLTRTHAQRKPFIDYLIENNIPFITLNGYPGPLQVGFCKALAPIFDGSTTDITDYQKKSLERYFNGEFLDLVIKRKVSLLDAIEKAHNVEDRIKIYLKKCFEYTPLIPNNALTPDCWVSTIHGVKGLEMDNVMILDDMGPSAADIAARQKNYDDELRVFYVGVTRARDKLYIVSGENPILIP